MVGKPDMFLQNVYILFKWLSFGLICAALTGVLHEFGHFVPGYFWGWEPQISFARGGSVEFNALPSNPLSALSFISLCAGPFFTFTLAGVSISAFRRCQSSLLLFVFAFWNSLYRLNVLIDGKGSDEYK